jgi:hypothetical protein
MQLVGDGSSNESYLVMAREFRVWESWEGHPSTVYPTYLHHLTPSQQQQQQQQQQGTRQLTLSSPVDSSGIKDTIEEHIHGACLLYRYRTYQCFSLSILVPTYLALSCCL